MTTWLTKRETADFLRICPETVEKMMERGDLQGFCVGRITRIRVDSVERLIGGPIEPNQEVPEDRGANGLTAISPEDDEDAIQETGHEGLMPPPSDDGLAAPTWPEGTAD